MTKYFLGADVGGTKTQVLIAEESGAILGIGHAGPGNHEGVGWDGLEEALRKASNDALADSGVKLDQISGAGFGIGGYDWKSQRQPHLDAIARAGFSCPVEVVNDAMLGLIAGAEQGWGIAVVSGTGCNCWGRNASHQIGNVTGLGVLMGEGAGATELIFKTMQALSYEWTKRGDPTALAPAFMNLTGASNLEDLLEGYYDGRYDIPPAAAKTVFEVAKTGDKVALSLIDWAGKELGEIGKAVIRQLSIENETFEVILIGSMFQNGEILIAPMRESILNFAPGANLKRLKAPPASGALMLGMEAGGFNLSRETRQKILNSVALIK